MRALALLAALATAARYGSPLSGMARRCEHNPGLSLTERTRSMNASVLPLQNSSTSTSTFLEVTKSGGPLAPQLVRARTLSRQDGTDHAENTESLPALRSTDFHPISFLQGPRHLDICIPKDPYVNNTDGVHKLNEATHHATGLIHPRYQARGRPPDELSTHVIIRTRRLNADQTKIVNFWHVYAEIAHRRIRRSDSLCVAPITRTSLTISATISR